MTRESTLPNLEEFERVLDIRVAIVDGPTEDLYRIRGDTHILAISFHTRQGDIMPLIEPAVTDPRTNDQTYHHPH